MNGAPLKLELRNPTCIDFLQLCSYKFKWVLPKSTVNEVRQIGQDIAVGLSGQDTMVGAHLTPDQRRFIVLKYHNSRSPDATQRAFQRRYPGRRPPSKGTIRYNYAKYNTEGTSLNLCRGRSGRRRTSRTQVNIDRVRREMQANPSSSARRNNLPMLTRSSFNRITKRDLKLTAYHIQRRHALQPGDNQRRLAYCNWLDQRPARFQQNVVIGDEAAFHLNGKVNSWNLRYYSDPQNRPRDFTFDRNQSRLKLTVWIGLTGRGDIIGPYFFDGNVNGTTYLRMIETTAVPGIRQHYGAQLRRGRFANIWWFQDGAPAHRARRVHTRLQQLFGPRVVSFGHPTEWPPRSPDLTPLDYFLWGYLKDRVYQTPPGNLQELQRRIVAEVAALRRTRMVRRAMTEMWTRARKCIRLRGGHIEGRTGYGL